MHRSSTIYKLTQAKTFLNKYVSGYPFDVRGQQGYGLFTTILASDVLR